MAKTRTIIGVLTKKFAYFEVGAQFQIRQPCNPANWKSPQEEGILGTLGSGPTITSIGLCPCKTSDTPAWAHVNLSDGKTLIVYDLHDVLFGPEVEVESWSQPEGGET